MKMRAILKELKKNQILLFVTLSTQIFGQKTHLTFIIELCKQTFPCRKL